MRAAIRLLDALGDWIAVKLTPRVQRRIGVLMIASSIPLAVLGLVVAHTPVDLLIYEMSALALTFGGLATIVAAVPTEEA